MSMAEEDTIKQNIEDKIKRGRELIAAIRKEYDAQDLIRTQYTKISRALPEAEKNGVKVHVYVHGKGYCSVEIVAHKRIANRPQTQHHLKSIPRV